MYRDLGFLRVWGGQAGGRATARARPARRPLRLPRLPAQADRRLPAADRASCSTSTASSSRTRRGPTARSRLPDSDDVLAKWMALKGDERRLITEANMHLPGRQIDPEQIQPRPLAPRPLGARAPRARRARQRRRAWRDRRRARPRQWPPRHGVARLTSRQRPTFDLKHRSRALTEGPERAAARAYLHGHRLRRRGAREADHRRRLDLDRDDAVQLPPARARRARSRRASAPPAARRWSSTRSRSPTASRWAPAGMRTSLVSPRGHRRLDRARRARPPLRRRRRALRLRQDDPRHRDGARAPRTARRDALRRLDPARATSSGRDVTIHGRLRGRRRARRAARSTDEELHEIEEAASAPAPAPAAASSPPTRWRWPSRCSGISPMRLRAWCPPQDATQGRGRLRRPASSSWTCSTRPAARATSSPATSLENAIAAVAASGGSTNGVLHLLAVAREAGVDARHRRLRPHLRAHAAALRPQARRALRRHRPVRGRRRRRRRQAPAGGRPAARATRRRSPAGRSASTPPRRTRRRGPGRRAPARRPAQADRRPRDPARQPRARGLRGQARRPRAPPPQRPGARVRGRGGRDGRRHSRADRAAATSS